MKRILAAVMVLGLTGAAALAAPEAGSTEPLVWCGIDYSMVKMIGALDFRQPEKIFPAMPAEWNALFMKEVLPKLESMAKSVRTDIKAVADRNDTAGAKQIEHEDGTADEKVKPSHITEENIAEAVRSYKLKMDQGLGLVFVMDRMVKAQETACMYVVFFDVASRKVLHSERLCERAGGIGFRNYWFRPIKSVVDKLPRIYKNVKAGK
jgi:hypothetical protein